MRINAYVLAADPAWIEASVLSYYDRVGRIVVSYDADGRGWTGARIDVAQCLRRLAAIDRDAKLDLRPGRFARAAHFARPLENDTFQRQAALNAAATDADWVVQLDTDEVVGDADLFFDSLRDADAEGFDGLDYPARWLYRRADDGRFLEQCRRGWRACAGYPGPVAVRAGATLTCARQGPARRYRVDFAASTTDPSYPPDTRIDAVIGLDAGIAHYSWTRSDREMAAKSASSSHARDFDWGPLLAKWRTAGRHPRWAALRSQFERGNLKRHLRVVDVALPARVREQLPPGFDPATGELRSDAAASSATARLPRRTADPVAVTTPTYAARAEGAA